jgi:hypothetical protein
MESTLAFYIILAASPVLLLAAVAFLVLIVVVGVRKRDHGDLAAPDRNRIDAITRRATGLGVRSNGRVKANAWNSSRNH